MSCSEGTYQSPRRRGWRSQHCLRLCRCWPSEVISRLRAALPLAPDRIAWAPQDADRDSLHALPNFWALYAPSLSNR